ncbi:uncharacterized protein LOC118479400 [Helianthus annuus]|uniref:uncharacterized protein LOC118479400 n=1 Tax=Helianthus annuus TaxID=4232 RepID=UPI00165323D9|nr:uncharacterized protein LOC118479400 [Helianthus annuus]
MTFRNVTETIIAETIAVPSSKSVEWFPQLQTIETVKLTNTQLWLLRMMLRRSKNSKPVVREKSGENAPAWRMFAPDFLGTVETVVCADGEEDHNTIIRSNFRVPTEAALAVELPSGKEPQDEDFSIFGAPESPPRATGAGATEVPSTPHVKVVPESTVQKEGTAENAAAQIFDTVDSSNNLISPNEGDDLSVRFTATGKQHSDAEPQKTGAEARQHDAGPQKSSVDKGTSSSAGGAGGMIFRMILRPVRRFWVVWGPPLKLIAPVPHLESCELANVKAANVALGSEKAAAEAISVKALQAKADALKALGEAKEAGAPPVRSPDVVISNNFMNSAFNDDEVMDNEEASQDSHMQIMTGAVSGSSHGPSMFAESSRGQLDGLPSNPYFVFDTPQGTRYWIPNVADKFIPVCGKSYPTFADVLSMYELYAFEAGFSVKKGQTKVWNGIPTHKYLRCSKYGKPQPKRTFDTLDESSVKHRRTNFTWCDCKASILVSISNDSYTVLSFNDIHNHELVESYNRDLSKISRKLSFSTKQFIHNMSLNRIGPMRAYRCLVALKGGHHNVNGTPVDFKNFSHQLRIFIGERDAQVFLERLRERFDNLPNFYFDYTVSNGKLSSVFWADEISKLNYKAFGDVLAFDATYSTNRYKMVFVPFTGVDHHFQCVTFGAGLISTESIESYVWLLKAFLKAHGTQPTLVLSDQDPSMLQAVPMVFTESRHRLCMWHIMEKLPSKISADVLDNTDLRSCIHRLVWNVYIKPETFESRWNDLLQTFGLQDHSWLNDMYNIKHLWVPAYFRELPMCCLMKTTSRCESSNAAFKVNSTSANTLVQL